MKKKILLFGPIANFGGRELETGFIAHSLSFKYEVDVCTTGFLTKESQLFHFDKNQKAFSLQDTLCDKYFSIKILSFLSYLKNCQEGGILSKYANNVIAKKYFGYDRKRILTIKELVSKYDLVFICAQLSSNLVSEVVKFAKENKKKVVFRTTGAIKNPNYNFLEDVDLFIHHSNNNANKLLNLKNHNYRIIDQCAFNEYKLLNIPYVRNEVKSFLTIARLVKEKNIDIVIKAFKKSKKDGDKLYVIGDGIDLKNLIKVAGKDNDIIFTGFVSNNDLDFLFSKVDCVIISYFELETGPLTGIEAMASARLIISSKTGAMEERLTFSKYWFENNVDELTKQIQKLKELDKNEVFDFSKKIRDRYEEEYSMDKISRKYLEAVNKILY